MRRYPRTKYFFVTILFLQILSGELRAESLNPTQLVATARVTLMPNPNSPVLDKQYEVSTFLDAVYLEKFGAGLGCIYQNQRYSNRDEIDNELFHINVWYSFFPELIPGKLSFVVAAYQQDSNDYSVSTATTTIGGNGPGPGMGSQRVSSSITRNTESLDALNPEIKFLNYAKTFYLDAGFASSDYQSSDTELGDLNVEQWTTTVGFALNERYDWVQLRAYRINLSNDLRSPGTDSTSSALLSWTHWLKRKPAHLESLTLKLLLGERIYAIDSEVRKIYNLSDLQKGSIVFGSNWALSDNTKFYLYGGYEAYEDLADEKEYKSGFVDFGISLYW